MPSLRDTTLGTYLDDVSSSAPTPGGGGVAALVGALAASLGAMVTEIAACANPHASFEAWTSSCLSHRDHLLQLCVDDERAFGEVMACLKLPKDDPARALQLQRSLQSAADVPLETAQECLAALHTLEPMASEATKHSVSDVGVAAHLALAAIRASALTVEVNRVAMADEQAARDLAVAVERIEAEAATLCHRIVDHVFARIRG